VAKIREYVALLRRIRAMASESVFVADPLTYGNAERYLQLAVQAVLDVSHHVAADFGEAIPADNQGLFAVLVRRKVISPGLAKKLVAMAGFRNILVHEYLEIDRKRVYKSLGTDLKDFEAFVRAVSKLL
jgi:uncharacterized protein YutE (UPF0331/DUF86 family)